MRRARSHQSPQALEIFGMIFLQPKQQGAGIVQRQPQLLVLFHHGQKSVVGVAIALLKNVFEISCWLMRVDDQNEVKRRAWYERQFYCLGFARPAAQSASRVSASGEKVSSMAAYSAGVPV